MSRDEKNDHHASSASKIEELLGEFNELLQKGEPATETLLARCPESDREELLSLMNTLQLARRALEPLRNALQPDPEHEEDRSKPKS